MPYGFLYVSLITICLHQVDILCNTLRLFSCPRSICGEILGPLLSKLVNTRRGPDVDLKDKMENMSCQIREYELLVRQLKVYYVYLSSGLLYFGKRKKGGMTKCIAQAFSSCSISDSWIIMPVLGFKQQVSFINHLILTCCQIIFLSRLLGWSFQ